MLARCVSQSPNIPITFNGNVYRYRACFANGKENSCVFLYKSERYGVISQIIKEKVRRITNRNWGVSMEYRLKKLVYYARTLYHVDDKVAKRLVKSGNWKPIKIF